MAMHRERGGQNLEILAFGDSFFHSFLFSHFPLINVETSIIIDRPSIYHDMATKSLSRAARLSCRTAASLRLPPTFLLPYRARSLSSNTHQISPDDSLLHHPSADTPPSFNTETSLERPASHSPSHPTRQAKDHSPRYDIARAPTAPEGTARQPLRISDSLRNLLPHLIGQAPFYVKIYIHGKPYLVTAGDTLRLPFLMHGVRPGDVLRLDRATLLGSRDYTMRAGQPTPTGTSSTIQALEQATDTDAVIGFTDGLEETEPMSATNETGQTAGAVRVGPHAYLDDRLFTCRATVMGTESEPLRRKEKTKQRSRRIKVVKSKHRYTILTIAELHVKGLDELEASSA